MKIYKDEFECRNKSGKRQRTQKNKKLVFLKKK